MRTSTRSFAVLLPTLALISSLARVLGMTGVCFYNYKHAAKGMGRIYLGTTDYRLVLQSNNFLGFAFNSGVPVRTADPGCECAS